MSSSFRIAATTTLVGLALGAFGDGCSLTNISVTQCDADAQCAAAFGPGSTCAGGYCDAATKCTTGHDCRKAIGGGACVNGACVSAIPVDPACKALVEPSDLLSQPLIGPGAPLVIGGIFSLDETLDVALTKAIRLAVTEINGNGALNNGQQLGIVFCDNGGPGNMASGDARTALNKHAIDYLAGTLGVPYLVGPLTSSDALDLVNEIKAKLLPTVIISPSATSPTLTTLDDKLHESDPVGLFWRTCPSDLLQAHVLSTDVIGAAVPKVTNVTVIYVNDAYGSGLANAFSTDWGAAHTLLVPYVEPIPAPGLPMNAASVAQAAIAAGGDAVLVIALYGSSALTLIQAFNDAMPIVTQPFYFTDGSEDLNLLKDPTAWIKTLLLNAQGTVPATPPSTNFNFFSADLKAKYQVDTSQFDFLGQAYDATYVGALGTVLASVHGTDYDGIDVALGMTHLSAGEIVNLGPASDWSMGKSGLTTNGTINIVGTSGALDFDPKTGEAPGGIAVWTVAPTFDGFVNGMIY